MNTYRKVRTAKGPANDLAAFQARVAANDFHAMSGPALGAVIAVYGSTYAVARRLIARIVCSLTAKNYSRTIIMHNAVYADEYGIMFDELGWYVKLKINLDDGDAEVCSCHLTRREMMTKSGRIPAYDPERS